MTRALPYILLFCVLLCLSMPAQAQNISDYPQEGGTCDWSAIKKNANCQRLLTEKPTIQSPKYGSCVPTLSGLLAAYHLGGADACDNLVGGGPGDSDGWTTEADYVCRHGGEAVPGDCSPAQYGYSPGPNAQDALTLLQNQIADSSPLSYTTFDPVNPQLASLVAALKNIWVAGFQLMTEQLVTNIMHQAKIIGGFFDAKEQLEAQRQIQQRSAQAHKDYHPSEQICTIGTAVRDLADSAQRSALTKTALSNAMLDRALATGDVKTSSIDGDERSRVKAYQEKFCSQRDNTDENQNLCRGESKPEQINADINYTQSIDGPLTLDIDLTDSGTPSATEETIFSFLDYIFMHDRFPWVARSKTQLNSFIQPYMDMRSLIAIRSVAQNSFAEIIAQKASGSETRDDNAAPFIKAIMLEMGVEDDEIEKTLGENPSYYAQMEVLTKKIYQHPSFVANLYDKPANVKRMIASMIAIKVMQDRDIHKALMRREMLMSMLLEIKLREHQQDLDIEFQKVLSTRDEEED